jgi:hypothetical protein
MMKFEHKTWAYEVLKKEFGEGFQRGSFANNKTLIFQFSFLEKTEQSTADRTEYRKNPFFQ